MALISQAEFARRQGFSRAYVTKLINKGIVRLINKKVDSEQAIKAMKETADPAAQMRELDKPDAASEVVGYAKARTMREAYRAQLAKLEYEEKSGKLTEAAKVKQDAFKSSRIIRDELLSIPERLADLLAAEDSPEKVQKLLLTEIEAALNRLCT